MPHLNVLHGPLRICLPTASHCKTADLTVRSVPDEGREHELLLASRGAGLWRLPRRVLFSDGFESGGTGRGSVTQL